MKELKDIRINDKVVPANFENVPADLKSKGIYFWFADQKGIDILLELLDCKLFDKHYITHEGQKLFLIYIGTAGTGMQKLSNLNDRFRWHLTQKHSHSSIKHGSLSNFRLALSLLLKTEVGGESAAQAVNEFMSQHLYISWTPYENETLISTDEKNLIKTFFPFINDDHNDKGYKSSKEACATKSFKELKKEHRNVLKEKNQKSNNPEKKEITPKEITSTMKNNSTLVPKKDDSGCFLIEFKDTDNLHEIVAKYTDLGGRKFLEFSNKENQNQKFYKKKTGRDKRRKTGDEKPNSQDIYKYFSTSGTTKNALTGKPNYKWAEVQSEMTEKGIKNAILKVCPQDNSPQKPPSKNLKAVESINSTSSNNFNTLSEIDFKSMEGKPKLLILPCSDDKLKEGTLEKSQNYFQNDLVNLREERLLMAKEKSLTHLPAIERYSKARLYGDLKDLILKKIEESHLNVIFISGLYGVLKFDDNIINYNLRVGNGFGKEGNALITQCISNYCKSQNIATSNVFSFLSPDYFRIIEQNEFGWLNSWEIGGRGYQTVWHNRERLKAFLNKL